MTHLQQLYPYYYKINTLPKLAGICAGAVSLFLLFFQPFGFANDELIYPVWMTSFIYGLTGSMVFYLYFFFLPKFFPAYFEEEKWIVGKEIGTLTGLLIVIGTWNFFLREFINSNPHNFQFKYLIEEIFHAILVGILPIGIFTFGNYYYLVSQYQKQAGLSQSKLTSSPSFIPTEKFTVNAPSHQDCLDMKIDEFLYMKAEGNYLEVYSAEKEGVKKKVIRNTLKNVVEQLSAYPFLIQTHRSYLVNLQQIQHISGNAQGYHLQINGITESVPVSRNHISDFKTALGL